MPYCNIIIALLRVWKYSWKNLKNAAVPRWSRPALKISNRVSAYDSCLWLCASHFFHAWMTKLFSCAAQSTDLQQLLCVSCYILVGSSEKRRAIADGSLMWVLLRNSSFLQNYGKKKFDEKGSDGVFAFFKIIWGIRPIIAESANVAPKSGFGSRCKNVENHCNLSFEVFAFAIAVRGQINQIWNGEY